jgi:hypothetical protein
MWDLQSNLSKDYPHAYTLSSPTFHLSHNINNNFLFFIFSLSVTTTTTIEHSPKPCQNSISHNQHKTSHATRISNSLIFKKHVSRLIIPFPFLSVTNPIHQSLTLFHCFGKQKTKATRSSPHSLLSPSIWPKTAPPWSRSLFSVENKFLHATIYALNHQFRHQQFKVR